MELVGGIMRQNVIHVGLAAADHDPLKPTVPHERLVRKQFRSGEIFPFAEPELDGVTISVNGAIELPRLSKTLDVSSRP